jgi:hypothetical protein
MFGCELPSTNFLSSVQSQAEDLYALKVMNFTSFNGFLLRFRGNPKFQPADQFPLETVNLESIDLDIIQSQGCVQKLGTGITKDEEVVESNQISVFPNPASNTLHISSQDLLLDSYRMIDQSGRVLTSSKIDGLNKFNISISNFQPGIYLIDLESQEGLHVLRQFVKI